ncbi:MAG: hypothetical protein ACK52I_06500, partial [Pseudomonadota bacterium]
MFISRITRVISLWQSGSPKSKLPGMTGKPLEQSIGRVLPQIVVKQVKEGRFARWFRQLFPNLRDAAIRWTEDDA